MKKLVLAAALMTITAAPALAETSPPDKNKPDATRSADLDKGVMFSPESSTTLGSVTVEGRRVDYQAVAGTLVVHAKGWDDAATRDAGGDGKDQVDKANAKPEASMFYVAYFKTGAPSESRPIIFLYNGGPGSSTMWLHMGAFGPRRVVTLDDAHMPAAPYRLVDNTYSLLDVADLVFIDAPGTGFGRVAGKDKEKAFFGLDPDAYTFSQFITGFLSRYGRWNSPKYLFGESYGTTRSAVLAMELETGEGVDLNGVVLLSEVLNFDLGADTPQFNPGTDQAYITTLPTFAATAWYHNRLGGDRPADLPTFLHEVEQFAQTDYALALQAGSKLDPARRQTIAERLSRYTGLPVAYVMKSDLRIDGGQFDKMLQDSDGLTTGRLDTRFSGPDIDPLSREADYDPQSAAIKSAYVSALNDYVRKTLNFGAGKSYRPSIDTGDSWSFSHQQPNAPISIPGIINVMPDLAVAMKYNPSLKIMVNGGYFDLATPYFAGQYEMSHLQIPQNLQGNIEYHYYPSGHMVYAHEQSLKDLHDNVAAFVRRTDNLSS